MTGGQINNKSGHLQRTEIPAIKHFYNRLEVTNLPSGRLPAKDFDTCQTIDEKNTEEAGIEQRQNVETSESIGRPMTRISSSERNSRKVRTKSQKVRDVTKRQKEKSF